MIRLRLTLPAVLTASCTSPAPPTPTATPSATPGTALAEKQPGVPEPKEELAPSAPAREGESGSTNKTVSCGSKRCKVGREVCAWLEGDTAWACKPKNDPALNGKYACDDASDCDTPLTCCQRWASVDVFECGKRDVNCKALPCSETEGTLCPKGQRYQDHFCVVTFAATCGSARRCPADKPYCAWTGAPECVGEPAALAAEEDLTSGGRIRGIYQCTQPGDCGTQSCCTNLGVGDKQTFCMNSCYSGGDHDGLQQRG